MFKSSKIFSIIFLFTGWAHSVLFSADLKHLQQLKKENCEEQNPISSQLKENSKRAVKEEFETSLMIQNVKQENQDVLDLGLQPKLENLKEEQIEVESRKETDHSVGSGDEVKEPINDQLKPFAKALKNETEEIRYNSSAKSKPIKHLKNKTPPLIGEISPFRRKKLKNEIKS